MPRARQPAFVTLDLSLVEATENADENTTKLLLDYKHQGYLEKHIEALVDGYVETFFGPCFRSVPGTTALAIDCDMLKADIKDVTGTESGQICMRFSGNTESRAMLLVERVLLLPEACIEKSRIDLGNEEYDVEIKFESSFSYADWSQALTGDTRPVAQRSAQYGAVQTGRGWRSLKKS